MTDWGSAIAVLVGAAGGAWATYIAARKGIDAQFKLQRQATADEQRRLVDGFLGAVEAEITEIWQRYERRAREVVRTSIPGNIIEFEWPVGDGYFTVFEANAASLGHVTDPELRAAIVRFYVSGRALLDMLRYNADRVRELLSKVQFEKGPDGSLRIVEASKPPEFERQVSVLAEYANGIRQVGAELEEHASDVLKRLSER